MAPANGQRPRARPTGVFRGERSGDLLRSSQGLLASSAEMIRASRDRLGQAGRGTALPPGLPTEGHLLLVGLSAALRAMRDLLDRFPLVSLPDEPAVLAHLQTGSRPNLLLLDLTSRSSGGWALLRGLASHPRWSRLPVAAVLPEDQLWTAVHLPVIKALPPGVSSAELRALVGFFVASALP